MPTDALPAADEPVPARRRPRTVVPTSVLVGGALLVLAACGGGRAEPATKHPVPLPSPTAAAQRMSEENFGYAWPLTVDHGTAECRRGEQLVFTVPSGTTYALNDRARAAGYRDIEPVRADGDRGDKLSLGTLVSTSMRLCQFGK
ncbi:DUF2511 domain-containing protein [Streptomyces sp. NPDC002454]